MDMNLSRITMGYVWSADMSFKEFVEKNKSCDYEVAYDIYRKIEQRYLQEKYEAA